MIQADIFKAAVIYVFCWKTALGKYSIGNAGCNNFLKFCIHRLFRHTKEWAIIFPHPKMFHVLGKNLLNPFIYQPKQTGFHARHRSSVFFMKPHHQAGTVLLLQLPMVPHKFLKTFFCTVGIHEVKEVFQAGPGILHINDSNASGPPIDTAPNPFIMPVIPCAELRGIRFLGVNQYSIVKGTLVEPCHAG
nr:hypothetical protein [uncultured Eisenbergiella sp.]